MSYDLTHLMKRTIATASASFLVLAGGCASNEPEAPAPTTPTSTAQLAPPLDETDKVDPPTPEPAPPVEETLEPVPYVAPEPVISYCGEMYLHEIGTTFYTDGSSGWTQYCSDQMSADQQAFAEAESQSGLGGANQQSQQPYYETSGEAQTAYGCSQGYIPANQCGG